MTYTICQVNPRVAVMYVTDIGNANNDVLHTPFTVNTKHSENCTLVLLIPIWTMSGLKLRTAVHSSRNFTYKFEIYQIPLSFPGT